MSDIIVTEAVPDKPDANYSWATERLAEYQYRKIFKLSYKEYMDEPIESYKANSQIAKMINDKENRSVKKKR